MDGLEYLDRIKDQEHDANGNDYQEHHFQIGQHPVHTQGFFR
jgi:hypothetical protein